MVAAHPWHAILDAWQLGPIRALAQPDSGTINEIVRATTDNGDYYLRAYRHPERAPYEHAAIAHARARGLPAIGPLPLPGGSTLLERDGRSYALFPRAPGRQFGRGALGPGEVAAMGSFLATLHLALRDYPRSAGRPRSFRIDRAATLAGITRLEEVIRRRPGTDPIDAIAAARLAARRVWLERQPENAAVDHAVLDEQLIHGDYQETNVFFAAGQVSAVIDWDQTYVASRAWEIIRTLDLVFAFAPEPCRTFLAAYRTIQPLALADLDCAASAYGLMRAYDLWLYTAYYLEGNDRVGRLITPGTFVPISDNWASLRSALSA
jgi:homoserine kinase type II